MAKNEEKRPSAIEEIATNMANLATQLCDLINQANQKNQYMHNTDIPTIEPGYDFNARGDGVGAVEQLLEAINIAQARVAMISKFIESV